MRTLAGRYELRDILSAGENLVYRAWDNRIHREVAVKLPRPGSSKQVMDRFHIETQALAGLAHPNLIEMLDVGKFEEEGTEIPFCVMPYLHGITLEQLLDQPGREPLSIARVIALTTGVARGLHAAHKEHLLHCDIKPSNIFVMSDDSVKLLDFGVAKVLHDSDSSPIQKGSLIYMAPEQFGLRPASATADVFALGVIVYHAMTGRHPFAHSSKPGTSRAIPTEIPIPVHEIRPEASREISAVVAKAMARVPEQRFATTLDMLRALENAERQVEAPPPAVAVHPDREALLDERFRLLTVKYSGGLSSAEFERLTVVEGQLAEIERRESQGFEAIFPLTPAGRLESSLDRLEQYVLTLKRAEH